MVCEVNSMLLVKFLLETVHARDYQEAKEVALARNPNAMLLVSMQSSDG